MKTSNKNQNLVFSPELKEALKNGDPVVALESTIISHGMPFPHNLEVARDLENAIRSQGAVPATMAILRGVFHAGLSEDQLAFFAREKDVMKCSRRDLGYAVSRQLNGATTVAATMILAHMADIRIFATGGIGGVHRHAEITWDVSADLPEFSRTPVAVVSAGAKAILDIPATLEYLETLGVPVIGFRCEEFPAFYSRSSGQKLSLHMADPGEMANYLHAHWQVDSGGVLVANPVPQEFEIPASEIEPFILQSIKDAAKAGIKGKETTPFLLKKLNELTAGRSQITNRELVLNNARVAAQIATELAKIR